MAFLSKRDERGRQQNLNVQELLPGVGFYETYSASVGLAIDEDLSISSALNREGWEQRRQFTSELIEAGQINRDEYTDRRGRFDYNRLADSGLSENIKTDAQLRTERNELLARKRKYAESVIERGSGLAQFLGMANAFVLDPINIATYPIATAGTAVKGLGALARAGVVARNEAALAVVAETGIQALVYEHKQDIESPYTMQDALTNIVAGAAGAAAIGGVIGGISGYFRKAAEIADTEPQVKEQAEQLLRLAEDMEQNPVRLEIDEAKITSDFIDEVKADLIADSSQKLPRGERKSLKNELFNLERAREKTEIEPIKVIKQKGVSARKSKQDAQRVAQENYQAKIDEIDNKINNIKTKLDADDLGRAAEGDLSRLEQGIIPERLQPELKNRINDQYIDADQKYLEQIEKKRTQVNNTKVSDTIYNKPADEVKPENNTTSLDQAELLEAQGLKSDYDRDIQAYNELKQKRTIVDGEIVDAEPVMKAFDDELAGLDEVRVCSIG